jgi:hypothetical protein
MLQPEIISNLELMGITNYKIVGDRIIVNQDVHCEGKGFTQIPVKIHTVYGGFNFKGNELKDFTNFPELITGTANMSYNSIESFDGMTPGTFVSTLNLDSNKFKNLKNGPIINHTLSIENNPYLESVENGPICGSIFFNYKDDYSKELKEQLYIYGCATKNTVWNPMKSIKEITKNMLYLDDEKITEEIKHTTIYQNDKEYFKTTIISKKFGL